MPASTGKNSRIASAIGSACVPKRQEREVCALENTLGMPGIARCCSDSRRTDPVAPHRRLDAPNKGCRATVHRGKRVKRRVARKSARSTALEFHRARRWRSPDSLLLPIAEALAKTLAAEDLADVKACEGPACTLMFVDRTRGRSRRWCSMGICGNRAKQIAHRRRVKESR